MSTTGEETCLFKIFTYCLGLCGIGIGFIISYFILVLFGTDIQGAKDVIFWITFFIMGCLCLFFIYLLYKDKKRQRGDQS